MKATTEEAARCCDQITKRSRQLDSLTSPASDASAMLSQAASNLGGTVVLMKDALEKFDTVGDCEPAIERLHRGVVEAEKNETRKAARNPLAPKAVINVSEQDVYAAVDSMEIIRDAFDYFLERKQWRSTPSALGGLERVHKMGVNAMCALVTNHLTTAGPAVRVKRVVKKDGGGTNIPAPNETATQVSPLESTVKVVIKVYTHIELLVH
jgi:exocyst complex protein 7